MSTDELVERFTIDRVGRSAAIFDPQKLRWLNGRFMREEDLDRYEAELAAHLERTDPAGGRGVRGGPGRSSGRRPARSCARRRRR